MRRCLVPALLAVGLVATTPAAATPTRVLGGDIITLRERDADAAEGRAEGHVPQRELTAQRHLAELGHVDAQFNLGVMYSRNERFRAAQHWYRKAALRGHREASYNLALLLLSGSGGPVDAAAAARWMTRAAEHGLPQAQYQLGRMHYQGHGVPRDPALELVWYRRAAEGGYPLAQHDLAVLYHLGEGAARDDVEAFAWFAAADANGFDSRDALAVVRATLPAEARAVAEARAAEHVARYVPR